MQIYFEVLGYSHTAFSQIVLGIGNWNTVMIWEWNLVLICITVVIKTSLEWIIWMFLRGKQVDIHTFTSLKKQQQMLN